MIGAVIVLSALLIVSISLNYGFIVWLHNVNKELDKIKEREKENDKKD